MLAFGSGAIKGGSCHVDLDRVFLDCVTVNEKHPLKVFVQLTSPLQGQFYVEKGETGFDVIVMGDTAASATFDYRVVGKWKGMEDFRLEAADPPEPVLQAQRPAPDINVPAPSDGDDS